MWELTWEGCAVPSYGEPSYGRAAYFFANNGGIASQKMVGVCGFFGPPGPAKADVECGFPHGFLRKSCSFFAIENSLHIFAVWFMEE